VDKDATTQNGGRGGKKEEDREKIEETHEA
jgi:hypothetical protein